MLITFEDDWTRNACEVGMLILLQVWLEEVEGREVEK
jgi:hypothetical protein